MRPLGDKAACVISFPDSMCLHTPVCCTSHLCKFCISTFFSTSESEQKALAIFCAAEQKLPKGYNLALPTSCSGAVVLASPIGMSSGMLRAVREQGRMLPISHRPPLEHWGPFSPAPG